MALPLAALHTLQAKKKQRQLNKEIANAPKYEITDEAYDNQAIAKGLAYGRNRAIQQQEHNIDKGVQDSISNVQDVSNNTSSLLSTIAAINANATNQKRALAGDEAMMQQEGKQALMGANSAMIDEKDKKWNYNENMPYQMKIAALRDRIKYNQEQAAQQFAASSNFMTSMFAGGQFNYQQPNSEQTQPQGGGGASGGGGMMKGMGQSGMGMGFR